MIELVDEIDNMDINKPANEDGTNKKLMQRAKNLHKDRDKDKYKLDTDHHKKRRSAKRGFRTVKKELFFISHSLNRDFFISIVGPLKTWFHPAAPNTEWAMMREYADDPKKWWRLAKLLTEDVLSLLIIPMGFILMARAAIRFHNTTVAPEYANNNENEQEDWWYVNGIGVNKDLQRANAKQMASMFERQILNFYNPTRGLLFDMFLALSGMTGHKTHTSKKLTGCMQEWLKNNPNKKLIIMAHSGGAILTVNAVRHLINQGYVSELARVEIYTFGSPIVDYISAIDPISGRQVPFYEHYVNKGDFVAGIGALRLDDNLWASEGMVYKADGPGHFFGEHYLTRLAERAYNHNGDGGDYSQLYKKLKV